MNRQAHNDIKSFTNKKFDSHLKRVQSIFLYPIRQFENLPIKVKLPLSFLFVIVIFTSLIGYSLFLTSEIQQKHQLIRESDLLIQQIYQFTHGVRDKYLISENLQQTHLEIEIKRFQTTQANNVLLIDNLRPHFISDRDRNMFLELERLNTHMDQVFTNELIPIIQDPDKHILINIPMSEIKNSMNQIDTLCRTIIRLVTANSVENIATVESEILQSKEQIRYVIIFVIIASLIFSILFTRSYARRLRQLVTISKEVQAGNLAFTIEMTESSDELGELSKAFMDMVQQLRNLIREIQQIFVEVQTISREIQARTTHSRDDAHQVVEQMLQLDRETSKQMQEMSTTSEWAISINSHLQETIAKLFMNNRQAIEVTEISTQGNAAIQEIMEWIEQIKQLFQHTAEEITGLTHLTEQVQSISTTVRGIASQTNLLALNAAIEAARSGESGLGFQVVAEEIKTLADRADISTREINGLLKDIRSQIQQIQTQMTVSRTKAETGMNRALATGELFAQINRLISAVGSGLSETSHHGDEVARLNEEMEAKIQELSKVSQSISTALQSTVQTVEDQKHRLERIFTLIPDLNEHLGDLAARVGKFTL